MTKVAGASHWNVSTNSIAVEDGTVQPAESKMTEVSDETSSSILPAKPYSPDMKTSTDDLRLRGNYVEASLRQQINSSMPSQKAGSVSPLNGLRLGWLKDGSEVKITRSLSPASGHESQMEAIAYARLTGANPTAVVRDREGKYHAVQLDRNFHGGTKVASDNNLREVVGLPHFNKQQIADYQKRIAEARD
jgi:hypothetical protein